MDTLIPISGILSDINSALHVLGLVWYLVLPPLFYPMFFLLWMDHIQDKYAASADWVVLELISPKNIEKSPKPMEALYTGFAGVDKSPNVFEEFLDGFFPDYMSMEIVSIEGAVHFYIRTMKKYRSLVEAHLYGQYPEVEIVEVPDYVNDVPKVVPNKQWDLWGADFEFLKDSAYPIRTYTAFEESVTGTMIDPLAGLVEIMGKVGPGQQVWLQWVIAPVSPKAHKTTAQKLIDKLKGKEKKEMGFGERLWKDLIDIFTNIHNFLQGPVEFPAEAKKEDQPLDMRLSPGERDTLKAVEANMAKLHFKTKGRLIYIGRRENMDKSIGVSGVMGGIKQFNDENLNSMRPEPITKTVALFVFKKSRVRYKQLRILRRYRSRSFDGPPSTKMVMSTEELATVFHLPDMNVLAPSISRVEAKRGGAPSNLPIE